MSQRVYVVTGSNRGIGFETVRQLCLKLKKDNATVIMTARSIQSGKAAADKLLEEGLHTYVEQLDVTSADSCAAFAANVAAKYKGIDCLINNAGFAYKRDATEPFGLQATTTCNINYFGTVQITNALAPLLRPGGCILFVASIMGHGSLMEMSRENRDRLISAASTVQDIDQTVRDFEAAAAAGDLKGWPTTAYGFSKAAVIAYSRALARQSEAGTLVPGVTDIVVFSCCPGWCRTDMGGQQAPLSAEEGAQAVSSLALNYRRNMHGKFVDRYHVMELGNEA